MKMFLGKIKNSDDCNVVNYIEIAGFECEHYFGGIRIGGACFGGFDKELRENYDNLETILSKEDFNRLFELNDELKDLGYGIARDSEKYNKGIEILEKMNKIVEQLRTEKNEELFKKVVREEKEFIKNKYNLTDEEVEEIFDNYNLEYKDRAIVGYVFDNFEEMVECEKFNFGYEDMPYFDDESFGNDLLENDYYLKLESGKIVSYSY